MNLHTQEKIIKNKLGMLNLAKELGKVPCPMSAGLSI